MDDKIDNYFDNRFGLLVLYVFIAGFIGDILIHLGTKSKFPFTYRWFAQSLKPYYESLNINNYDLGKKVGKLLGKFLAVFIGGILGGLACVLALVFGQIFLYAHDMTHE